MIEGSQQNKKEIEGRGRLTAGKDATAPEYERTTRKKGRDGETWRKRKGKKHGEKQRDDFQKDAPWSRLAPPRLVGRDPRSVATNIIFLLYPFLRHSQIMLENTGKHPILLRSRQKIGSPDCLNDSEAENICVGRNKSVDIGIDWADNFAADTKICSKTRVYTTGTQTD